MSVHEQAAGHAETARRFLARAFMPDDWVAVFLKAYDTGRVLQRVAPVAMFVEARWLAWLRVMNEHRFNIYVSVNAMTPGRPRRTKASVSAVRQLFLDIDRDGPAVLNRLMSRTDVPVPSCVVCSSPGRAQVLWRVHRIGPNAAEALQKWLASEFGGDTAATAVSQTGRLPGFANHKYSPPSRVSVEYGAEGVCGPSDFPAPVAVTELAAVVRRPTATCAAGRSDLAERARRYLAAVPPAVAGEGGDLRTFRVCCRLVRGFALTHDLALQLLADWNARCDPPWTDGELIAKLEHAQRYGREPIGGLLSPPP